MVSSAPYLPAFQSIPIYVGIDSLIGFCASKIRGESNTSLVVTVCAVRALMTPLIFHLINVVSGNQDDLYSHKIFLFTALTVDLIFVIALKELALIGELFSFALGLLVLARAAYRVIYIQKEDRLIEDQSPMHIDVEE